MAILTGNEIKNQIESRHIEITPMKEYSLIHMILVLVIRLVTILLQIITFKLDNTMKQLVLKSTVCLH